MFLSLHRILHKDGCRSICKNLHKTQKEHIKSHPDKDKGEGSYFYKKNDVKLK